MDVHTVVAMEEIPKELIINWNQTGMKYVPVFNWTFAEKGVKRVEIAGLNKKCDITVLLSCIMAFDKVATTQKIGHQIKLLCH